MSMKLPRWRAVHLTFWLVIGGWLLGLWAFKPVLAVENMQPGNNTGRIAGHVTNFEGNPLMGIKVTALRYSDEDYATYVWEYTNSTITDGAGAYQIPELRPGIYTVHFSDPAERFAAQYYDNSYALSHATTFDVAPVQTTSAIDARLQIGAIIHGAVHMYNGAPIPATNLRWLEPKADLSSIRLLSQDDRIDEKLIYFDKADKHFDEKNSTFTFRAVPPGIYTIWYKTINTGASCSPYSFSGCHDNYFAEYYPNVRENEQATIITVTEETTRYDLDIIIGNNPNHGRIQGRITAADGKPLAGMAVIAQSDNLMTDNRSTFTDATGSYEIPDLIPGNYRLFFLDPTAHGLPYDPIREGPVYSPKYYNDKPTESGISTIQVLTGTTIPDINVTMQPGKQLVGRISMADGSLIDSNDTPLSIGLSGKPHTDSDYSVAFEAQYDLATGRYTIGGLEEGVYNFEYSVQHKGVYYSHWSREPITISIPATGVATFDLIIPVNQQPPTPIAMLLGKVTDEDGQPLSGIKVRFRRFDWKNTEKGWKHTDANGEYLFHPTEPGSYTLAFSDPKGNYAFEYYHDTPVAGNATPILIEANSIISDIQTVLTPAAMITGQVTLLDGTPLRQLNGAWSITLLYNDSKGWLTKRRMYMSLGDTSVTCDPSSECAFDANTNTYAFAGLASGEYRLIFSATHNGVTFGRPFYADYDPHVILNLTVTAGVTYPNTNMILGKDNQRVLALYALALDHDPDRIDNLAPQLAPAMQSIIVATRDQPNKTAVVLADAAGVGDTRIYVVRNGRATPVQGLPNAALQLDPTVTEANMADGVTLGNFIRWARNSYPAEVTLFGFVGHGAPLVPATGFAEIVAASGGIRPRTVDSLFPLPTRVGAYPSLTDNHPQALITPYDLATALRIGSNNGADPLQIADVAHCFAASIEELYELSPNGDQPYAEIILASPTYTYLDPPALGQALGAINTLMTPARMADQILQTYDALIAQADLSDGDADVEHPRLLVAVNSRQVARVKQDWDKVAYHLLQNFDGAKIRQAYQASPHYDTTVCHPQDWTLGPPDALADLYGFAAALVTVYGADSPVGAAATVVLRDLEDTAILSRYQRNGVPWYAPSGAPLWNFDAHQGIALFADLQGRPTDQPGAVELSWQARWYTADPLNGENPHPYAFVQNGFNGVTWATLFAEFWRRQPGVTIQTALCFPELASEPQTGELRISALSDPLTGTVRVGLPFTPTAVVQTEHAALKPTVRFNLYDANHALLLSDTVQGGYWLTGTHQLTAMRPYTPTAPGDLTIEVIVDPTNNVSEANEADNRLTQRYTVAPPDRFPLVISARLAEPTFFVNQPQVALHALVSPADSVTTLVAQLYQFTNDAPSAPWQSMPQARQTLDLARPTLVLNDLSPGVVVAHIWAHTAEGYYSARPAVVIFNYAPANQPLAAGQTHHYWLATPLATALQLELTGGAHLFAWSPFNGWGPEWRMDGSPLILPASALTDGYRLAVTAVADSQYTLTAQPTASPPTAANATPELSQSWPDALLRFVQPVIDPPGIGALVAGRQFFLPFVTR